MIHTTARSWRLAGLIAATAVFGALATWWGRSPSEIAHLALVPAVIAYVALYRPSWSRQLATRHLVYFAMLGVLAAAYLVAMARTSPVLRVRWSEWAWAVYMLLAIHVVVVLVDLNVRKAAAWATRPAASRHPALARAAAGGIRVTVLLAVIAPYIMATFMTHWVKLAEPAGPADSLGPACRRVNFETADGIQLAGWYLPAGKGPTDATVIIAPSHAPSRTSVLCRAHLLAKDFNVFFYDGRGQRNSGGHTHTSGQLEARDAVAAVSYVKTHYPQAARHVFGVGIREGALAMTAAAARDDRIEALVLDDPVSAYPVLDQLTAPLPGALAGYVRQATLLIASAETGCNLMAGPQTDLASLAPRPILLICNADRPAEQHAYAAGLASAARGPVGVWVTPGFGLEERLQQSDTYRGFVYAMLESVRRGWDPIMPSERG